MARKSIEDWFLSDVDAMKKYFGKNFRIKQGVSGYANLKELFEKKHIVYVKGTKVTGFLDHLNISEIMHIHYAEIGKLCKELGMKCRK